MKKPSPKAKRNARARYKKMIAQTIQEARDSILSAAYLVQQKGWFEAEDTLDDIEADLYAATLRVQSLYADVRVRREDEES